jgi:hypothetical protein
MIHWRGIIGWTVASEDVKIRSALAMGHSRKSCCAPNGHFDDDLKGALIFMRIPGGLSSKLLRFS